MPQINFNDVLTQLGNGLTQLAKTTVSDYLTAAEADGKQMLASLSIDLQNWTTELSNGDITSSNLVYLVTAKKDLIEMDALKQAGLAEIRLDQFKNSALQLIISTITGLIPKV
jgi:hypothetical protein